MASEFSDFTKPLDKHSYQACLDAIHQADLFVLMIGSRVGGWYDEPNKVSITEKEYDIAYKIAQQGGIRLVSFVRNDLWIHRQSAKELERYLRSQSDIDDSIKKRVSNHPTVFSDDSSFIFRFLDKVCRNKETAAAVKGSGTMPIGNWVHPFNGFGDIRGVLEPLILSGLTTQLAAGRKALQNQLVILLRDAFASVKGKPVIISSYIKKLAKDINLAAESIKSRTIRIENDVWNRFMMTLIMANDHKIPSDVFSNYLSSDLLLSYNTKTGVFDQTDIYDALTDLVDQMRSLEFIRKNIDLASLMQHGVTSNRRKLPVNAPAHDVGMHLSYLFRWADVIELARALAVALDNKPLSVSQRMPLTPFLDEEEKLAAEKLSIAEVRSFLQLSS